MKMSKIALFLVAALVTSWAAAETPTEAAVKKLIEPRLGAGNTVDSVKETPYGGLFEVRSGGDIFYTDKAGQYLIVGHVYDTKTSEDLTKLRIDDINKVKFSDLPLASAIKTVKGNGKRVIATFEDPNCGYCKRFSQTTLKSMDNVTVYTFLYNILTPDSAIKSANIWCASDRSKAWGDWMVNGKMATAAPAGCASPSAKILELGQKLRVTGTPSIFFVDGSRIPGAVDAKTLEAKLDSLSKPQQ